MPGDKPVPTLTVKTDQKPEPTFTVDPKINNVSLEIGLDNDNDDDFNVTGNKDDSVSAATEIVGGDLAIRLQKLSQQYAIEQLRQAENAKKFSEELFKEICEAIQTNLKQDPSAAKNPGNYPDDVHVKYAEAFKQLHEKVDQGNPVTIAKNNLTVNLTDGNSVNVTYKPAEHRILFASSDPTDQSLVILLEGALKAVKKIGKAQFVIYPSENIEQVAKLCAMAKQVGLNPVFKPNPSTTSKDAQDAEFSKFNQALSSSRFNTNDPSELANKFDFKFDPALKKTTSQETKKPPTTP